MKVRLKDESVNSFLNRVHLSKKKIYDLKINNKIKGITNYDEIISGVIEINLDEEVNYKPEKRDLDIIYEDDNYLVINKPRGIIIHDEANSLANVVANYYIENNIKAEIRFPSRLDRDTTGVVIFAKNMISASYLDFLFENNMADKQYVCLCHNRFQSLSGKINYSISTDRHNNNKMVTTINGKKALTLYKVLINGDISYVSLKLKTGRTHQIRVHLEKIGHSILGDKIYGDGIGDLMLHCKKISFVNFDNKKLEFEAKMDSNFNKIVDKISA